MIIIQYEAVIRKLKTNTRRTSVKDTYKVGHVYSVVPKRTWPTVWYQWCSDFSAWGYESITVTPRLEIWHELHGKRFKSPQDVTMPPYWAGLESWHPLKIRILSKHWEPLQDIDEAGAIAEGIREVYSAETTTHRSYMHDLSPVKFLTAVEAYSHLWDRINGKSKQFCWAANPNVQVHKFELAQVDEAQ